MKGFTVQSSWQAYYKKVIQYPYCAIVERAVALVEAQTYPRLILTVALAEILSFFLLKVLRPMHLRLKKSIEICQKRLAEIKQLNVLVASFYSYRYPKVKLVVAHSSLFFCPDHEFNVVWEKIVTSIEVGAVFCGDFLGTMDTWISIMFLPLPRSKCLCYFMISRW